MMRKSLKTNAVTEYGDFQTPPDLARLCVDLLVRLHIRPYSILEPTCGRGSFAAAAAVAFSDVSCIVGVDINADHLSAAANLASLIDPRVRLIQGDFFKLDWRHIVTTDRAPWLILGNPPWVTNTRLGVMDSENLPQKSNHQGLRGIEAITGKSNFDISEWMLLRYLDWLRGASGTVAVLCKTSVARKILLHPWKSRASLKSAGIYKINAHKHFGAAVDACFFFLDVQPGAESNYCDVFDTFETSSPSQRIGYADDHLIPDILTFNRYRGLLGREVHYAWRSGIKHDCSKVMEFSSTPEGPRNGFGEVANLEDGMLFPLLKSSDIGNGRSQLRNLMLVTQHRVGEDTSRLRLQAPQTWAYLHRNAELLNRRGSVIYKNNPAFSIFGVGPYTFAPWKIAISGFYKSLRFVKVGQVDGKPVVFDDTIYFLPCWSSDEADFIESLLASDAAQTFLKSMIHWDEKRPVTVNLLKRLSLFELSSALGREKEYHRFAKSPRSPAW